MTPALHNLPRVGSAAIASTVAFALARGVPISRLEAASGTSIQELLVPSERLPLTLRGVIWQEIARSSPDEDRLLSFEMAATSGFSAMGGLADAVRVAPDLRSALQFLIDNSRLLGDDVAFALDESRRFAAFFMSQRRMGPGDELAAEAGTALKLRLMREVLQGELALRDFTVQWAPKASLACYLRAWGAVPTFEQGTGVALVFDKQTLDQPLCSSNLERFRAYDLQFELQRRLLGQAPARVDPHARLQRAIAQQIESGDYSVRGVAREAGMSVRSAQRIAAASGQSLRHLIDDSRAILAKKLMMRDPLRPIGDVAFRVGYSDERAFRRAFKRWTDMTPSDFRRTLLHVATSP
ncbi:MAG: helix-turn-helix domain-containing protein [Pseudomonadota bacterium]